MPQPTTQPKEQSERNESGATQSASTAPKQTDQGDSRPPWKVEGGRPGEQNTGNRPVHKRPSSWLVALLVLLAIDWLLLLTYEPSTTPTRVTVPYRYFLNQIHDDNVASITAQESSIQGTFRHAVTYPTPTATTSTSSTTTTSTSTQSTTTPYFQNRTAGVRR